MLDTVGQRDRFEELLRPKFKAMFCINAPQYQELTLAFLCTFKYKDGNFVEKDEVAFALGRNTYQITVVKFGEASQFYTQEEVESTEFLTSLKCAFNHPKPVSMVNTDFAEFWSTIVSTRFQAVC